MKIALAAFAFALLGCAQEPAQCRGRYRPDGFDAGERQHISNAFARWSAWSGKRAVIDASDDACSMVPASGDDPGELGSYWEGPGTIEIDVVRLRGGDPAWLEEVVLHELGHSFGMKHLRGGDVGIMSGGASTTNFTDVDRVECERAGLCR